MHLFILASHGTFLASLLKCFLSTFLLVGTCNELNAAYAADGYARIRGLLASLLFKRSTFQLHIRPWTISILRCWTWSGFSSSICPGSSNNQPHCSISHPFKSYTLRSWARIEHLETSTAQYLTFAWWSR